MSSTDLTQEKTGADFCGCQGDDDRATEAYNNVHRGALEDVNAGRREKPDPPKKHPCPDCTFCQWCGDDRCNLCLSQTRSCRKKLSLAEQIALYDALNRKDIDASRR